MVRGEAGPPFGSGGNVHTHKRCFISERKKVNNLSYTFIEQTQKSELCSVWRNLFLCARDRTDNVSCLYDRKRKRSTTDKSTERKKEKREYWCFNVHIYTFTHRPCANSHMNILSEDFHCKDLGPVLVKSRSTDDSWTENISDVSKSDRVLLPYKGYGSKWDL